MQPPSGGLFARVESGFLSLSEGLGDEQLAARFWAVEEAVQGCQRALGDVLRALRELRPERGSRPQAEPGAWRD